MVGPGGVASRFQSTCRGRQSGGGHRRRCWGNQAILRPVSTDYTDSLRRVRALADTERTADEQGKPLFKERLFGWAAEFRHRLAAPPPELSTSVRPLGSGAHPISVLERERKKAPRSFYFTYYFLAFCIHSGRGIRRLPGGYCHGHVNCRRPPLRPCQSNTNAARAISCPLVAKVSVSANTCANASASAIASL